MATTKWELMTIQCAVVIPSESDFNYYSKEHGVRKFVHFMGF